MESGDGLIVRIAAGFAGLRAEQVRALARLAREHGNGLLELTRRANLQLRGVTLDTLPALQTQLVALGLADPERKPPAPALICDPLSGLDPRCAPISELALRLEACLQKAELPRGLPAKFGIVLDAGSGVLDAIAADLHLVVSVDAPEVVRIGVGAGARGTLWLGACAAANTVVVVQALLAMLAELGAGRRAELNRALEARGVVALRAQLEARLAAAAVQLSAAVVPAPASRAPVPALIGLQRGTPGFFGVGLAFGSGDATTWEALAELATRYAAGNLRLTPRRVVLFPSVTEHAAAELTALAERAGLIVRAEDPLLRASACAGAPACRSAWGETRALACSLAREVLPLLAANATLHVSGCLKACAQSAPATLTLVHAQDGARLGWDTDAAQLAAVPGDPLERVRERLAALPEAR